MNFISIYSLGDTNAPSGTQHQTSTTPMNEEIRAEETEPPTIQDRENSGKADGELSSTEVETGHPAILDRDDSSHVKGEVSSIEDKTGQPNIQD